MSGASYSSSKYMSPTACASWCYARDYDYFGVEYGVQVSTVTIAVKQCLIAVLLFRLRAIFQQLGCFVEVQPDLLRRRWYYLWRWLPDERLRDIPCRNRNGLFLHR